MAQNTPLAAAVDSSALRGSICDAILAPSVEERIVQFGRRIFNVVDDRDGAGLDADVFQFLKEHAAAIDTLFGIKKSLRANIVAAGKNIDPRSDLQKIIPSNIKAADEQIAQLAQIRMAVSAANNVNDECRVNSHLGRRHAVQS